MSEQKYVKLNNGVEMPVAGIGTFLLSPDEAEVSVLSALQGGYRLIDTANAYVNEEAVGKGVKRAVADGLATREELFITTKVWVQDAKSEDTAYEAVKASLAKLDMSYVDLILLHQPMGDYFAAYRGIEKACKEGVQRLSAWQTSIRQSLPTFVKT
jgi:diketogulonate reductase-like aldo/keto reductase